MPTFSNIALEEPTTVTQRVGTVTIGRGSTNERQEILCIGDPDSSNAIAATTNAAPASTSWGLVTRPWLSSTAADNPRRAVLSSTSADNPVRPQLIASTGLSTLGSNASTVNATADVYGRVHVRHGHQAPAPNLWQVSTVAGQSAAAGITRSSAAGVRQVVTGFTVTITGTSSNPSTAYNGVVALIDGSTGGSTYLWRSAIALSSVAGGITSFNFANVWHPATLAGPVALEFTSSGSTNSIQSCAMWGTALAE